MTRRATDIERVSPSNLDAERSVLGSLLIENSGYDLISSQLDGKSFFREAHRKIYKRACHLLDHGTRLDYVTLSEELERAGELDDIGGPAYIASLTDGVPRSTNIRYYAEIVKEKAAQRALIRLGTKLVDSAYTGELQARDLIRRTDGDLTALAGDYAVSGGTVSVADSMQEMSDALAHKIDHKGQLSGVSSGWPKLDLYTHGWQRRSMVVVAAQTSFGKSVFGLQSAMALAAAGQRVIYYSLEMSRRELLWRAWSMLSEIPLSWLMWGNVTTKAQFAALAEAQERLSAMPLEINDSSSTSITDIRGECRQIRADRGLGGVVVDYFQRMDIPGGENRAQKLGEVSRQFFDLVGELDLTGFMLSQLTVDGKDATREPQLEDLRDCKSLGHDASTVIMLHPYNVAQARTDISVVPMKALFRKQRGGHPGLVTLHLERDYVRFIEGEAPETVAKPTSTKKARTESPAVW